MLRAPNTTHFAFMPKNPDRAYFMFMVLLRVGLPFTRIATCPMFRVTMLPRKKQNTATTTWGGTLSSLGVPVLLRIWPEVVGGF